MVETVLARDLRPADHGTLPPAPAASPKPAQLKLRAQEFKDPRKDRGRRDVEGHPLAGDRMDEAEMTRMEQDPVERADDRGGRRRCLRVAAAAVEAIADDRVPEAAGVHPDLVRSP